MKYFGQYLISKGIISEDILANALVEQISTLPTSLEITYKNKLLKSKEILEILTHQFEHNSEFKKSCSELGFWSPLIESEIQKELEKVRIPLGHILIKNGSTDLGTITKALDDFLSRVETPPAQTEPVARVSAPVDPILLEEFLNFLTDDKIQSIQSLFEMLKNNATDDPDMSLPLLQEVLVALHSLRGLMRCIKIERSEEMVSLLEALAIRTIESVKTKDMSKLPKLSELGIRAIPLLQLLKKTLIEHASEGPWIQHAEHQSTIKNLCSDLQKETHET